jgi:hypothetical protein
VKTDPVVIVSGAWKGIGKAVCELFMQARYKVVALGNPGTEEIPSFRSGYLPILKHIQSDKDGALIIESALEKFHHLDLVVHAACNFPEVLKPEIHSKEISKSFSEIFFPTVILSDAALSHFSTIRQGHMIFLTPGGRNLNSAIPLTKTCADSALISYIQNIRPIALEHSVGLTELHYDDALVPKESHENQLSLLEITKSVWQAARTPNPDWYQQISLRASEKLKPHP